MLVVLSNIGSDPVVDLLALSDVQVFAVHDSFAVVEKRELKVTSMALIVVDVRIDQVSPYMNTP